MMWNVPIVAALCFNSSEFANTHAKVFLEYLEGRITSQSVQTHV